MSLSVLEVWNNFLAKIQKEILDINMASQPDINTLLNQIQQFMASNKGMPGETLTKAIPSPPVSSENRKNQKKLQEAYSAWVRSLMVLRFSAKLSDDELKDKLTEMKLRNQICTK